MAWRVAGRGVSRVLTNAAAKHFSAENRSASSQSGVHRKPSPLLPQCGWFALIRLNSLIWRRKVGGAADYIAKRTAVLAGTGFVPLCTALYRFTDGRFLNLVLKAAGVEK